MKTNRFLISILLLLIISLACNLPSNANKNVPTAPKVTVDPQELLNQAVKVDPNSKSITITLTEDQMNALLLNQIDKIDMPSGTTLKNPSVKLQNGMITILAQIESGLLTVDAKLSLKPVKNGDNQWQFEVAEADFGALPVPDGMKEQFAQQINDVVTQSINQSGEAVTIDSITISDGKMVVIAHH
jgi:hypothetical protein